MLRIFLSTSHLSTIFMAIHAKKTHKAGDKDVLIVESARIKESLLKLIHDTGVVHQWNEIHDFVTMVSDDQNMKPTLQKTLTRKLKSKPVAKQIYNALYDAHLKSERKKLRSRLEKIFQKYLAASDIELNLLTQTPLNPVLLDIFPKAKVNYFEHGLGDYLYVQKPLHKGDFHCVFHEPFKKLLSEKKLDTGFVLPSVSPADFEEASLTILDRHPEQQVIAGSFSSNKPSVLILMEAVEMYNVKKAFWTEYIEKCLKQIQNPKEHFYYLKPHPIQSKESIGITKDFFVRQGLEFKVLDHPVLVGMSSEVLFPLMKKNVRHVFALFSSSVFYTSVLYPSPATTFHCSYGFMEKNSKDAPDMYTEHFKGLKELVEKVFSYNCRKFS